MYDILKKIQVHIPFHKLYEKHLPLILKEGINPEISFNGHALDHFREKDFLHVGESLMRAGLRVTLHAPFMDLRPGAVDPRIRRVTVERLRQVFGLVSIFRPRLVVCHPSFDERYYVSSERLWLENSIETWREFVVLAEETGTFISFENVYEGNPRHLRSLIDALDSAHVCFCFDTGHFNVFSKCAVEEWIDHMGGRTGQLHLHDNDGRTDQHLPVGEGNFPFRRLFDMIGERGIDPVITVEPHSEKNLWKTVENIEKMGLFASQ
ncbi:MAG: sugar phosphate isomerase/epimerase family protein [Syntrophales bacterium]